MLLRAGPSSLALPRAARLGSVGPRPHLLASTSPSSPRHMHTPPSHFDTHALVARLESSGLTRQQASELVASLHAAVSSAVANLEASLIPRAEAERWRYSQKVDFARLKSEIQLLERNEFALMKSENERLMADVEKLKQKLREEITRTTAGVRLDLNLEKGRIRDESSVHALKIKEVDTRIESEIATLRTSIQSAKFNVLQTLTGVATGAGALLLAYLRMFR
ncbi:mitochondrion protein [Tilletiopsis washingtonensis]|uniref:Mitochondrion protein n=1 Tax=Tilletiopsis washingtonensis TaxID=58919 RepID=A0A316YZX9_9BASI|nr:mitochondrion protein [Tilletiopsis washingtonensis]PWN94809.1 mitochondrion protein [Tilletiopsis washingtonensis]